MINILGSRYKCIPQDRLGCKIELARIVRECKLNPPIRSVTGVVFALLLFSAFPSDMFDIGPDSAVHAIPLKNYLNLTPISAEASRDLNVDIDYKCPIGDSPAFGNGSGPPRYCEREILLDGSSFPLRFKLAGGIYNATIDPESRMLAINFINGWWQSGIQLALPRQLIDARSGNMDSDFMVMLDGQNVDYIEASNSTTRELFVVLSTPGNHIVQIIGTSVAPEFPSTVLILSLVMISALFAIYERLRKCDQIRRR